MKYILFHNLPAFYFQILLIFLCVPPTTIITILQKYAVMLNSHKPEAASHQGEEELQVTPPPKLALLVFSVWCGGYSHQHTSLGKCRTLQQSQ